MSLLKTVLLTTAQTARVASPFFHVFCVQIEHEPVMWLHVGFWLVEGSCGAVSYVPKVKRHITTVIFIPYYDHGVTALSLNVVMRLCFRVEWSQTLSTAMSFWFRHNLHHKFVQSGVVKHVRDFAWVRCLCLKNYVVWGGCCTKYTPKWAVRLVSWFNWALLILNWSSFKVEKFKVWPSRPLDRL